MPTNNADLDRLIERFWGVRSADSPVHVTTDELPPGHVLVEEYAVVPSIRHARFLVPTRAPRAVSSAFTSHLATVSPSSRVAGRAIALGFRTGAAAKVLSDRLRVGIDRRVADSSRRDHLMLRELAHRIDAAEVVAVHPVRRATPNAKPTVRLFSPNGAALGHAKLGWSPPTASLVRNEAAVLELLAGEVAGLTVPTPRTAGHWEGNGLSLEYLVTSALPPGLRTWRTTPEDDPTVLTRIAATGHQEVCRLAESGYADTVRRRLAGASAAEPQAVSALSRWFSELESHGIPISFGRWHGDWVAWNLARTPGGGAVWDWEYSAPQVPVGFDLLHWHFQTSLADPQATLDTAAAAMADRLAGLERLGVAPGSHRHVADLYLVEMLTRAVGLAAEGSGWNPKLFPRLISFSADAAADLSA